MFTMERSQCSRWPVYALGRPFTGTTWKEFNDHGVQVSGFREGRWGIVKRIKTGDLLLCYLTGVQRWVGVLRVTAPAYRDTTLIWKSEAFPCRLKVEPIIVLTPETGVPMSEVMRDFESPAKWGGLVRGPESSVASGRSCGRQGSRSSKG